MPTYPYYRKKEERNVNMSRHTTIIPAQTFNQWVTKDTLKDESLISCQE